MAKARREVREEREISTKVREDIDRVKSDVEKFVKMVREKVGRKRKGKMS
ncbi:hypothetical protein AGMMS49921_07620 [Endomicrobiia bacterium]|nr:hypothetical protein AGMMS49921_07620 [Endomicrobiia bacterium]